MSGRKLFALFGVEMERKRIREVSERLVDVADQNRLDLI
jgi:hypothetical protein